MLVLDRKVFEWIVVTHKPTGQKFRFCVAKVLGGKAKLGFEAGPEFAIHRQEVQERIEKESHEQ